MPYKDPIKRKKWDEEYKHKNRAELKIKNKLYRQKNREKILEYNHTYKVSFPEKVKARDNFICFLRKEKIQRGCCEICQKPNAQAHHDDYNKPLEIRWLCSSHHAYFHRHHIYNPQTKTFFSKKP